MDVGLGEGMKHVWGLSSYWRLGPGGVCVTCVLDKEWMDKRMRVGGKGRGGGDGIYFQ